MKKFRKKMFRDLRVEKQHTQVSYIIIIISDYQTPGCNFAG